MRNPTTTLRDLGLYGGRLPTEHPAAAIPDDYRSTAIDIDDLREMARVRSHAEDQVLETADEATLQRLYEEAKANAADGW